MSNAVANPLGRAFVRAMVITCQAPYRAETCARQLLLDDQVPVAPGGSLTDRASLRRRAIAGAGWMTVAGVTMCAACYGEMVECGDLDDGVRVAAEVDLPDLLAIEVRP